MSPPSVAIFLPLHIQMVGIIAREMRDYVDAFQETDFMFRLTFLYLL